MSDQITVRFECKACGATVIELPDYATEDSIAKCKACGQEFGRWGDVKAQAIDAAKAELLSVAKDAFKGLKRWKVK